MYRGRLQRDLSLWVEKGFIEPPQASAIMAEYDSRPTSFSLGRVLSILAALLVAAAILLLVASNWELIPRPLRVGALLALIWAFYLGGAFYTVRGQTSLAAGLLLLGTMSFGGAMSLVGQMYHISGDELPMMLTWFLIACLAAALFRSGSLVALAGFLSWAYFSLYLEQNDVHWIGLSPWAPPLMAAVVIALVRYVGANRARHLAYLLLIAWLTWLYSLNQQLSTAVLFAAGGMIAFLAVSIPGSPLQRLTRDAGAAPAFYTFLVAVIGFFMLHVEIETGPRFVVLGVVTLAASVAAIGLCGRDNGAVRYLAYAVFASEILYLASQTIGSIIGTSGFFLICGLLVAVVAWLVIRLERRFGDRNQEARS
ncbi:DUF2157 domain-containing protein [Rhizobium sp. BK376]|jgi:uncharacterized membrane protein|uniref:DUF2157 domain-containing protein n=1 Tax=Rhizobium sp. BK376 TaxID=2512149 RepID=UPI001047B8AF|nr:DUF2157 domain-containing protein [Rhizobium sp. BK376]TCR92617.1 putative membrane protein [Rhizobium sp. BK376]